MTFAEKIRLTIESVRRTPVMDLDGPRFVHAYRMKTHFCLPGDEVTYRGLVDTGAPLTVLPEAVWTPHLNFLQRVTAPRGQELPKWLLSIRGIDSGSRMDCVPAFVMIQFFDIEQRFLKPRRIMVKCALDGGAIEQTLIGLGGHVWDKSRLEIEYNVSSTDHHDEHAAWLNEMESRTV